MNPLKMVENMVPFSEGRVPLLGSDFSKESSICQQPLSERSGIKPTKVNGIIKRQAVLCAD